MKERLLEVQNVSVVVSSRVKLLKNVSFSLNKGEKIGVIGANGAGKTTLLRTLYGAIVPTEGCVLLEGQPLTRFSVAQIAQKMAAVLQEMPPPFQLKVFEVVSTGQIPFQPTGGQRTEIVTRALDAVGALPFATRAFHTLSGGEKQRVWLARALAQQPTLLLLDEPTNHLDLRYQWEMMRWVAQGSYASISVLHDLNLAAAFCERLLLLKEGELLAVGTPHAVLTEALLREAFQVEVQISQTKEGKVHVVMEGAV